MDQSRQERMKQRLRGGQIREVKDVDFGLVFPVAAAPVPPTQVTQEKSQPELPAIPSANTPTTEDLVPAASITHPRPVLLQGANDANTSAKRKKLETDLRPLISGRNTRSRTSPRPAINTLPVGNDQTQSLFDIADPIIGQAPNVQSEEGDIVSPPPAIARSSSAVLQTGNEAINSPGDAPDGGHRGGGGLDDITSSELAELQSSSPSIQAQTTIPTSLKRKRATPKSTTAVKSRPLRYQANQDAHNLSPKHGTQNSRGENSVSSEVDDLSPEQPTKRNRKSRGIRQDLAADTNDRGTLSDPSEQEEAEPIGDEETARVLQQNRALRQCRMSPIVYPDLDDQSQDIRTSTKQKTRVREDASRAQQRQPKKSASKVTSVSKKANKNAKPRAGSPIPITVHRLSKPLVYDEDESDAEILNAKMPRMKRNGVNAVDVLSQICREQVGKSLGTLEAGWKDCHDRTLSREYKNKWHAVEAFGDEVQARLRDHTVNLDNVHTLEKRVRDEHKKKLGLRDEILSIRAEREKVALRMDEIRIRHENESISALERESLSIAVHDIELAVELGKSQEPDENIAVITDVSSVELLLQRVAGEVTGEGDSGGILRHIREFNAFLERTALVLESGKA